ncbi:glycosyltransferase 87 family protein [Gordonia jinhuaensis]|uniref:glycosyltransferase 87 family protein n=1 Tax=Gordonia jinhuaensis TaxID=1517702 RepID=UPI0016684C62|nr:glycosyltransferase 87 family protein [Gordonia jinhuaensis]
MVAALAASVWFQLFGIPELLDVFTRPRVDVDVYRLGAATWRAGVPLYANGSMPFTASGLWLPFTYPPFAALVFLPLSFIGPATSGLAITAVSIACLATVSAILVRTLQIGGRRDRVWVVMAMTTLGIWLNPVWTTLGFGQFNIVLMTLVMVDLFVIPSGRRGVLIGIAAAIKLTPLAFVLCLAIRGERRAAVTGLVAFVTAGLVAAAWAPDDTVRYWTSTLTDSGRIGDQTGPLDQNIFGFWIRLIGPGTTMHALWAICAAAVTVLALVAIRRIVTRGDMTVGALPSARTTTGDLAARHLAARHLAARHLAARHLATVHTMAVTAIWAILVCPTSWAHHWVWVVPALTATAVTSVRAGSRRVAHIYGWLSVAGLVVFAAGAYQLLPHEGRDWSLLETPVGNAYLIWGVAFLVISACVDATSGGRSHADRAGSADRAGVATQAAGFDLDPSV